MAVSASEALASLGFTGLESEIYAFLLSESPATGYRIAQAIGKPVANTYKAIQTLEAKGAIVVDDEKSRKCQPIPVEDLLGRLAREFEGKRADAHSALASLGSRRESERIFTLKTRDAVLQQSRVLIDEAKIELLVSATSTLLSALEMSVTRAKDRGVQMRLRSETGAGPADAKFGSSELGAHWPGEAIVVTVDGEQCLFALLDKWAIVVQAGWGHSPFLALILREGQSAGACLEEIRTRVDEGAGPKRIAKTLASLEPGMSTAGFKSLQDGLL